MAKTESVTALIEQSIKVNKAILKELREQNTHLRVLEGKIATSYYPLTDKTTMTSDTFIGTKN